jgi:heptosyltransferase I
MSILLVKLSSLGDVIHNLPVVADIRRHYADASIDWVTEAPYAPLVALHSQVNRVHPVRLRALKKSWWRPSAWSQFFDDKARLTSMRFDRIIDTQGLSKSAMIAKWPTGTTIGMDRDSIREPFASRFYDHTFAISKAEHAVTRNRLLAAKALGYEIDAACDYGLSSARETLPLPRIDGAVIPSRYVVFLQATSRANKSWPATSWVALGRVLNANDYVVLLPSGTPEEFAVSDAIAKQLKSAHALPARSLVDTASLLAHASAVVGVDTGLAHLAVALGRPTVGIYVSTDPAKTGLYDGKDSGKNEADPTRTMVNVGGGTPARPNAPSVVDALAALGRVGVSLTTGAT